MQRLIDPKTTRLTVTQKTYPEFETEHSNTPCQPFLVKQTTARDCEVHGTLGKRHPAQIWITVGLLSFVLVLVLGYPAWQGGLYIHRFPGVDSETSWVVPANALEATQRERFSDNGRTDQVQWDRYSLLVKGQRIFLHSGEFHTFRLPVPSLWPDILQKVKAAGLNAVSVYTHMGLINPSPGVIDLEGFRALQPLFDAAKDAGLFIVLRPGPYINAETSAGGIAHWVTSEVAGTLKTNVTDYRAAWQAYIQAIIDVTVPNQITEGGPVIAIQIDNEIGENSPERSAYFAQLEEVYHNSRIVVPLTYNDPDEYKNFINGTGAVDLYGLDSYPQGFDCSNPTEWKGVKTSYYEYHKAVNPSQPWYTPEFQGGSFDAWGPTAPGYLPCHQLTGPDFQSVFNLQLWASNFKLINYYMIYGGTSWGALPFPGVYTSYDYGSAIAENRDLTTKYAELKRQGLFLRSSPEFYKTNVVGNSTSGTYTTSSAAFVTLLRNPDTDASFYIVRQTNSTSTAITDLTLNVSTSAGIMQIPQVVPSITLAGRQSKVIVTNYKFGHSRVLYATAQILFAGQIGGRNVLYMYGDATQQHEAGITLTGTPNTANSQSPNAAFTTSNTNITIVSFLPGIEGLVTVWDSDEQLILFSDTYTAGTFWSPLIPSADHDRWRNYWQYGTNDSILVGGPYLVRNASISGSELALRGDLKTGVRLFVIAPSNIRSITWNGERVSADASFSLSLTYLGGFVGQLQTNDAIAVPALRNWKYADSLPEIRPGFTDAPWTVADHTSTNIPYKPYYGDGRILYGCDYGFCENIVLWRGHFNATGDEKSFNLSINGGQAFAASVWLNDVYLNTSYGNSTNNRNIIEETDDKFYISEGALRVGEDNVVTVLQDNMGLNETDETQNEPKGPRGIRGFQLDTGTFSTWKVQGKVGGYTNYPDRTRGVFNEGGLYGERKGWHLPGFNTSSWVSRNLSSGLPGSDAGVGFFVTTFELNIPSGFDVPMSFTFDRSEQPYRAYLFVNGWMMGKRVANLGPQFKFPVHQGILDYNGLNTVAVALWAMEPNMTVLPTLELTVDGVYEGGVGGVSTNNPPWLPEDRL